MTNKILLITPPDDVHDEGVRILLVDLREDHTKFISEVLTKLEDAPTIISYVWNTGDDINWLLDKKHKSDIVIFNADSYNQTVVGYLAAYKNSHYFGTLKDLHVLNKSAIYSVDNFLEVFNNTVRKHESEIF